MALKEARGMYLPRISLEARYSWAGGGRLIEMPIGDLVNPIHETLNQLLLLNGLEPGFPADIENEVIPFLRPHEHETKLRIIQPIFQPAIFYNSKIKSELNKIQKAKLNAFKRQLVSDIKTAYFTYLKTLKIKELLDSTRLLLEENLRISKSLFKNHKVTEEIVFRSKAELSKLDQQIAEAEKGIQLAASYFNFLLNQPLDKKITISPHTGFLFKSETRLKELEVYALAHRFEFKQLYGAINAARYGVKLQGSKFLPSITAVFDYGFQGEKYGFTSQDDFWMASLVLSWNLFNGFQDSAQRVQAKLEKKRLMSQLSELENKIRLQVKEAYYKVVVAKKTIRSSQDVLNSRKEAFHIVSKKYEQGMVPQIEYIQARNDYTNAGITNIIAIFDCYIREARLEQASATRKFTK
jgi:outer membrane protein TolC